METQQSETFVCGEQSVVGLLFNGNFYKWGKHVDRTLTVPQLIPGPPDGSSWVRFFCGSETFVGKTSNSNAYVWGSNRCGELGIGKEEYHQTNDPILLPPPTSNTTWKDFVIRCRFIIATASDGNVYVWGSNHCGQLGLGDFTNRSRPELLSSPPNGSSWSKFFCGYNFTIGMSSDNRVYSWGMNDFGQLGLGHTKNQNKPKLLAPPERDVCWKQFVCGAAFTIGITSLGEVYVWGNNKTGHLGLGSFSNMETLPKILPPPGETLIWVKFYCGYRHTFGIASNGEAYCWGFNDFGELGIGLSRNQFKDRPEHLPRPTDGSTWEKFYLGNKFSIGVTSNGNAYVCGTNRDGQLGLQQKSKNAYTNHFELLAPPSGRSNWNIEKILPRALYHTDSLTDIRIGNHNVHSCLISWRCPILVDDEKILQLLTKDSLSLLIDLIYGNVEYLYSAKFPTLFHLYDFTVSHGLEEYKNQIFDALYKLMKNRNHLIEMIDLATYYNLSDIIETIAENFLDIVFPQSGNLINDINGIKSEMFKNYVVALHVRSRFSSPGKRNKNKKRKKIDTTSVQIESLKESLKKLFETGYGHDSTILLQDGSQIPIHKFVVCSYNKYFYETLGKHPDTKEIDMSATHILQSSMRKILEFTYCGTVSEELSIVECAEILSAQKLEGFVHPSLVTLCIVTLRRKTNVTNCLNVLYIGQNFGQHQVIDIALAIATKHMKQLTNHSGGIISSWNEKFALFLLESLQ